MTPFVGAVRENSAAALEAEVVALLQSRFEDWEPLEGELDTWIIKAFARIASIVREQASVTMAAALKKFGETIARVPPIQAAAATVASTWTMLDDAGYPIRAGTLVKIAASGDEFAFRTLVDVVVPPGQTETGAGEVLLQAVDPGAAANGLSADPTLFTGLNFVDGISLVGVSAGGVDEEDEDAYLDRLTEETQLLSLSLITTTDFQIDARSIPGIARDLCVPGYNPETETFENLLTLCQFPITAAGQPVGPLLREALLERQRDKLPTGVELFADDPAYTAIDVKVGVVAEPGNDPGVVGPAVKARLEEYLSPERAGTPQFGDAGNQSGWLPIDHVYRFELVSEADRVGGVKRVQLLELAKAGAELGTADVALAGAAALTEVGDVEVIVE